jgi:hypothetical protein
MNIFILGTCRIQRPFGCDYGYNKPINYNNYNVLNSWGSPDFLGPQYNIKEIYQFLHILINNNSPLLNLDNIIIKQIFKYFNTNNNINDVIENVYKKFKLSDIIIIEISSIKNLSTIINNTNVILNLFEPDLSVLKNYDYDIINEIEFIEYLNKIIEIINTYKKKVLFVSHFNHNNIKNRENIINILKNNLPKNMFFDPSELVINNLPNSIIDDSHYSKDMELLIMDEFDLYIKNL